MRVCVTRTCHVTPSASRIRVLFSGSAPRLSSAAFTTRTYRSIGALSWLTNTRSSRRATPRFRSQHHESARVYFFTGELFSALILISIFIT
jgi:hypothetical protein